MFILIKYLKNLFIYYNLVEKPNKMHLILHTSIIILSSDKNIYLSFPSLHLGKIIQKNGIIDFF